MRGHARELDVDLGRGQEALLHDGRLADSAVAAHMGAEEPVEIVHDACGGHGTSRTIFGLTSTYFPAKGGLVCDKCTD